MISNAQSYIYFAFILSVVCLKGFGFLIFLERLKLQSLLKVLQERKMP